MKRKELADKLRQYRNDKEISKVESTSYFDNERQISMHGTTISLPNESKFTHMGAVDGTVIVTFSITLTDKK